MFEDSLIGWVAGALQEPPPGGDSLIGWVAQQLHDPPPGGDSLVGYAAAVLVDPPPPLDGGIRVHTTQGLQLATVRTWTANGWT